MYYLSTMCVVPKSRISVFYVFFLFYHQNHHFLFKNALLFCYVKKKLYLCMLIWACTYRTPACFAHAQPQLDINYNAI